MQKKSISNNYIAIQGWMVEQLGLKGNELLAYALIHGFSQDGKNQFTGSLTYIQQWLNCAHSTAVLTLQSLVKKQLIKNEVFSFFGARNRCLLLRVAKRRFFLENLCAKKKKTAQFVPFF